MAKTIICKHIFKPYANCQVSFLTLRNVSAHIDRCWKCGAFLVEPYSHVGVLPLLEAS